MLFLSYFVLDIEDDEWPESLKDCSVQSTCADNLIFSELEQKKSYNCRQIYTVLRNISAILASVGAGFDIRMNKSFQQSVNSGLRNNVKANCSECPKTGVMYHTYHGTQIRYRPAMTFDIPVRFTECVAYCASGENVQSNRDVSVEEKRVLPVHATSNSKMKIFKTNVPENNFLLDSHSPCKLSSEVSACNSSLALISLSPSTDHAFVEFQRQLSDVSSATTPQSTPHHQSRHFEEVTGHQRSPSVISGCSAAEAFNQPPSARYLYDMSDDDGLRCQAGIPSPICPPPIQRRSTSRERYASAERPATLDIIARPRPHAGTVKFASPGRFTAATQVSSGLKRSITPLDVCSENSVNNCSLACDNLLSPHPVFARSRNILDVDIEGQKADETKPLSACSFES